MTQAEFSQGIELPHCSAYEAYQTLLRGLLLKEFPCGLGEWREDHQLIQAEMSRARNSGLSLRTIKPNLIDYASSVTLKDVNASAERTETLSELTRAKESPWHQTCDWTEEGAQLRDLAISEPWTLGQSRVDCLLRTLKVHDRNVGEIDKRMRKLSNLRQLVLSANYLTWIDGHNLPPSLEVLELHGNFLEDLAGLLPKPPPVLEHLGVGRNNLAFVGDHLSGIYWPHLLSLDLSFNHLCDLKNLLESLATLPKLRSLILAGNPLALTPWYRGYTVDHLRQLLSLDDTKVTADERHYYRGMVRRREFIQEHCQLQIRATTLKNIPIPPEIATPDEFPEYPVIVRKYYIRFWLPFEPDETSIEAAAAAAASTDGGPTNDEAQDEDAEAGIEGKGNLRKSAGFMSDIPEEPPVDEQARDSESHRPALTGHLSQLVTRLIGGTVCSPVCSGQRTYAELTAPGDTADQINWEGQLVRNNLRVVRDFLMHGVQVDIVEEKSLLYPPDQLPQEGQEVKPGQERKKDEKAKDDAKPKKKKKVDESSLVLHSTEATPLASLLVDMSQLLTSPGQKVSLELRTEALTPPPTVPSTPANADKKSKDGRAPPSKDDKKKPGTVAAAATGSSNSAKKPSAKPSATSRVKGDNKGKGGSAKPTGKKNQKDAATTGEFDDGAEKQQVLPTVEAQLEVQRIQWRSVKDCPTAVVIAVDHN